MKVASPFSAIYEQIFVEHRRHALERAVVMLSVVGFLIHLGLIFAARHLNPAPPLIAAVGHDYLSAISTPFNFVLFYEVLILISAIPKSTTQSIASQYEIVSLIFVRGFFQDLAEVDLDPGSKTTLADLSPALQDVTAGITMFLLVTVFKHFTLRGHTRTQQQGVAQFIERKKAVSLGLTILFLALAAHSIWEFVLEVAHGSPEAFHGRTEFYAEVFTVMIFSDVLILLLSLLVSDDYELVFRNAAFVISTILIRFSLSGGHPLGAEIGVAGMLFGIVTVLIYNYHCKVHTQSNR
jgi:hypothetical protein